MKILLVNDYKDKIAGTEVYMWNLKIELENKGHKVSLFTSKISKKEYIDNVNIKSVRKYASRIFNYSSYKEFKYKLKLFMPDVIHIQNIFNEISPSILLATKSIPVIMTVHDNQLVSPVSLQTLRTGKYCKTRICGGCINCVGVKGAIYEYIKRKLHKILLKKIKMYITPSIFMENFIAEAGFLPHKTVYNGIKLFKPYKIKNDNIILYIGRLSKDKGVEYLIQAVKKIHRQYSNVRLLIVGDGKDKKYFESLTSILKLQDIIKFFDSVKSSEIERYYKESTIVVVPSLFDDNLPTVCIEAMSMGRPLVGTNRGGIPELIKDRVNGYIVPSANSNDLANKITLLLKNKNLSLHMAAESIKISKRFSIEKHVNQIEQIYKTQL